MFGFMFLVWHISLKFSFKVKIEMNDKGLNSVISCCFFNILNLKAKRWS